MVALVVRTFWCETLLMAGVAAITELTNSNREGALSANKAKTLIADEVTGLRNRMDWNCCMKYPTTLSLVEGYAIDNRFCANLQY
jgi:hypothetical protein